MIYFILFISFVFNITFIWFIYKLLNRQADLVALVEDLQYKIDLFSKHMQGIYELPMYYGEPTIEKLLEHSKILLSSFDEFNENYKIYNEEEEEYEQLQEKTQDEE